MCAGWDRTFPLTVRDLQSLKCLPAQFIPRYTSSEFCAVESPFRSWSDQPQCMTINQFGAAPPRRVQ